MKSSVLALCGIIAFSAQTRAAEFEPRLTFAAPDPSTRSVALTLDACSGAFDQRILDALVKANAKATIFVTERWLKRNPSAMSALMARPDLFQIENHGAMHVPVVTDAAEVYGIQAAATIEGVRAEVEGGSNAIAAATGSKPRWFRGATARYTTDSLQMISRLGLQVAGYSLNADGGASLPAGEVVRRMQAAKSGDVLIAHINQPFRPAGSGVAEGVKALAASGATFVRLDEVTLRPENDRPAADGGLAAKSWPVGPIRQGGPRRVVGAEPAHYASSVRSPAEPKARPDWRREVDGLAATPSKPAAAEKPAPTRLSGRQ